MTPPPAPMDAPPMQAANPSQTEQPWICEGSPLSMIVSSTSYHTLNCNSLQFTGGSLSCRPAGRHTCSLQVTGKNGKWLPIL